MAFSQFRVTLLQSGDDIMSVTFDLPNNIEKDLRRQLGDLNQAAKEAALVELYRQDKLSQHELAEALGISRLEVEAVLKKHNVTEDLLSVEDYDEAISYLRANTKK
jgi:predicted HTH domain antitoxin